MSKRFKSSMPPRPFPAVLGHGGRRRILKNGDNWLLVWREELAITWPALSKASGIAVDRISEIERDEAVDVTADEIEALARGLGTNVEQIEDVQD